MIVQKQPARFGVGDKVRVISYDPTDFTKQWWNTRVRSYKGYELTICEAGCDEHGFFYDVDECDIVFDERWLEPVGLFSEDTDGDGLANGFAVSSDIEDVLLSDGLNDFISQFCLKKSHEAEVIL